MIEYHSALREMKKSHFDSMHRHKSTDLGLKKQSTLRVLEIGAGSGNILLNSRMEFLKNYLILGANFEFFPPNSKLVVVEPNAFFEPMFYENQSKYPHVKMDKFVVGSAENMKDIEDNSVGNLNYILLNIELFADLKTYLFLDIVVSTLVLCSVASVEQTLKEVHRVLAPVHKNLSNAK